MNRSMIAKLISRIRSGGAELVTTKCGSMILDVDMVIKDDGSTYPPFGELYFDRIEDLSPEEIDVLGKYQYSLLSAIETLRMMSNGSFGGGDLETVEAIYNLLCGRLDDWRPGSSTYDECVKKMLELTLEQYRNSFWRK